MVIKTEIKAIHLKHPEHGTPAVAAVVKDWFEHGRLSGYELQFAGESHTRHLRFKEIRRLQGIEEEA